LLIVDCFYAGGSCYGKKGSCSDWGGLQTPCLEEGSVSGGARCFFTSNKCYTVSDGCSAFNDDISCTFLNNGINNVSAMGCFFLDDECHVKHNTCDAFKVRETCESTDNGAHTQGRVCMWVRMSGGTYGCVNSASITDCSGYINESACNNNAYLNGTEKRGCLWSNNSSSCVRFKCGDYEDSADCMMDGKNVSEVCFWNSVICRAVVDIISCEELDRNNCGNDSIYGGCFWNGAGSSGSCKNYYDITSCSQLKNAESCRKTKNNYPFVNVPNCAWVRVGNVGDVGECKISTDINDCKSFYFQDDCNVGVSYLSGNTKSLIFCFFVFFIFGYNNFQIAFGRTVYVLHKVRHVMTLK
jgi:hypothetical protein